jgi:hypothetical protein
MHTNHSTLPLVLLFVFVFLCASPQTKAELSEDQQRHALLTQALSDAAGVYVQKNSHQHRKKAVNASNTIWISVVELHDDDEDGAHLSILKNYLCFLQNMGLKSLLYLVGHNSTSTLEPLREELSSFKETTTVLPYPDSLFWETVNAFRTDSNNNKEFDSGNNSSISDNNDNLTATGTSTGTIDIYTNKSPSFHQFGELLKLIPVLESLTLGYSVLYSDIDTVFLHNPLPLVLQDTKVDLIMASELRDCRYPAFANSDANSDAVTKQVGGAKTKLDVPILNQHCLFGLWERAAKF